MANRTTKQDNERFVTAVAERVTAGVADLLREYGLLEQLRERIRSDTRQPARGTAS